MMKLLIIGLFAGLSFFSSRSPAFAQGSCNTYGCWRTSTGGCNTYGCWENSGGCNTYGCWNSPEGSCNTYGCTNNGQCNTFGCPPSLETADPPRLRWTIIRHNLSIQTCHQQAYQALRSTRFVNLKTGESGNVRYVAGDRADNTARIACQNDSFLIFVAGRDTEIVSTLYNSIVKKMKP